MGYMVGGADLVAPQQALEQTHFASSSLREENRQMVIPGAALTRDTQFKHPPTPAPPPPGTKVCGFESGSKPYCGVWADSRSDKFDWTRKAGRTPSYGTGPSSA